jgi:glycosyltransferase involved in cell wall biosynthesis
MPKLSIVSPIWRTSCFPDTIQTYLKQGANRNSFEVLFMVSNPDVYEEVKDCVEKNARSINCRVIEAFNLSNCVVRNIGAALASGEILVFTDGDQLYCSSFIEEHLKLQPGHVGIGIDGLNVQNCGDEILVQQYFPSDKEFYGRYVSYGYVTFLQVVNFLSPDNALAFSCRINAMDNTDYVNLSGRNCSFYKDDFLRIGGFDDDLGYSKTSLSRGWEDREIGIRAFEKDLKFQHIPCWPIHPSHSRAVPDNDSGFLNLVRMTKKHPWILEKRQDIFLTNNISIEQVKKALADNLV